MTTTTCNARFQTVSGTTVTCGTSLDEGEVRCSAHAGWTNASEQPLAAFDTAEGLRRHLDYLGVVGAAQDALVRETAAARHALRVERAREAALSGAADLFADLDRVSGEDPGGWDAEQSRVAAALLLRLDRFGVGGRDGVEGLSTDRLAPFSKLGSGRKQARDGGAWDSALSGALTDLLGSGILVAYAERDLTGSGPAVNFWIRTGDEVTRFFVVAAAWAPAWILPHLATLAREALRRAAGLHGWHDATNPPVSFEVPGPQSGEEVRPAVEVWGAVVNALTARGEELRAAADEQVADAAIAPPDGTEVETAHRRDSGVHCGPGYPDHAAA